MTPPTAPKQLASATRQTKARARRQLLRGSLGLLVIGSTGLLGWQLREQQQNAVQFAVSPQTQAGQIARQILPDGSHITMSGGSALQVRYSARQRTVAPLGEPCVAKDSERPFVISSGAARITVLGTRFVVSRLPDLVRVSVASGNVHVALEAGSSTVLQAGEVAEITDHQPPEQAIQRVQRSASTHSHLRAAPWCLTVPAWLSWPPLTRYRREPIGLGRQQCCCFDSVGHRRGAATQHGRILAQSAGNCASTRQQAKRRNSVDAALKNKSGNLQKFGAKGIRVTRQVGHVGGD